MKILYVHKYDYIEKKLQLEFEQLQIFETLTKFEHSIWCH